jgi:ferredoxin--NADP+ reductase
VIGTNKKCAQETVASLLEDVAAGALPQPRAGGAELEALVAARQPDAVEYRGWEAIDAHERGLGETHGRPRVKLTRLEELLRASRQDELAVR